MFNNTDKEWESYGKNEPYYGVISNPMYKRSNLTKKARVKFFRRGRKHIHDVLDNIRAHIDPDFSIKTALDFGCGVGRLIIPLSQISERVTGVDVSESMLNEAKLNCDAQQVKNAKFIKSDDELSLLSGTFNFIHSYIVFQHIPVRRGERLFENLLSKLEDGGVGVFHFTYSNELKFRKIAAFLKNNIPFAKNVFNLIKGRNFSDPIMQMNEYYLNTLFRLLQRNNINNVYIVFTDHASCFGMVLYFQKGKKT